MRTTVTVYSVKRLLIVASRFLWRYKGNCNYTINLTHIHEPLIYAN
jgi:hypothetical protein